MNIPANARSVSVTATVNDFESVEVIQTFSLEFGGGHDQDAVDALIEGAYVFLETVSALYPTAPASLQIRFETHVSDSLPFPRNT